MSITDLYASDYRLRPYIFECLKQKLSDLPRESNESFAIQIALCYRIGFGVAKNDERMNEVLRPRRGARRKLENIMGIIKTLERKPRKAITLFHQDHIDYDRYSIEYNESERPENAKARLIQEITDLESSVGDTQIVIALKAILAIVHINQWQWKEAEELQIQVVKTQKRLLGKEHPETLTSIHNLASTFRDQGRWKETEQLQTQVMKTRKKMLGVAHLDTLASMNQLALTFIDQGRWRKTVKLQMQVMKTKKDCWVRSI